QDSFKGRCRMEGHNSYQVEAIDESEWTPFLYWQRNLVVSRDRYIDLWLEYQADDSLDIRLRVYYTRLGSINELVQVAVYTEEDLKETITLDPSEDAYATCCLEVK
ncbi:accessory Sec system protein Asp2, partial [Aerococcus urinae]